MKCSIIIIRHGKTTWNDPKTKRFTGLIDVDISEEGKEQAEKVALMLRERKIATGYRSSLKRSWQTLDICLKYHKGTKKITDDRIIERSYGDLQGKKHVDVIKKYGAALYEQWHRGYDSNVPNGESIKDVERRTFSFCNDLLQSLKKTPRNVVISGHNNSLRAVRTFFEKLNVSEEMKLENPQDDYIEYTFDTQKDVLVIKRNGAGRYKKTSFWTPQTKVKVIKPN